RVFVAWELLRLGALGREVFFLDRYVQAGVGFAPGRRVGPIVILASLEDDRQKSLISDDAVPHLASIVIQLIAETMPVISCRGDGYGQRLPPCAGRSRQDVP